MSSLLSLVSASAMLDLALKSAAVMLLAVVSAALLGRASAAWRHLVWCLAVVSLLLLPALSLALPAWQVAWLPSWTAEPTQPAEALQTNPGQTDLAQAIRDAENASLDDRPREIVLSSADSITEPNNLPTMTIETIHRNATEDVPDKTTTPASASIPWLAIAWGAGALLALVPLAVGLAQLAALHRRSRVIDNPCWLNLLNELRRQLAVRRGVRLRECEAALAPLTWGALRPVLLVPAEASAWPDERRRLVLLHELAHVRRWDWLTQLVAHAACAMYWFNPLVWLAARQMRIERERACDDLVLASGARASDYAQELLALAAGLSHSRLSSLVAVPMARRGVLEDRLRGILDSRRSRAALTTAAVCLGALVAAAAVTPLAMLRAAAPQPSAPLGAEPEKSPPVKEKPAAEQPAGKPAEAAAPQKSPLLGKEAAARVKEFPPSFSKAQEGVEVGIAVASDRKAFHEGERVPLDFVVRNVSDKSLLVEHALYPPETPPTVIGPDGKQISIKAIHLFGANRRYRDTLAPNEVAVYRHLGLGLGEKAEPPGTFWPPFIATAAPGKYRLSQQVHLTVREEGRDDGGKSFRAASGEVEFEIALADPKKGVGKPEEKPVEKPAEKIEKPIGTALEDWGKRQVTIRGKVVDDATMEPIAAFIINGGKIDPANAKNVIWGGLIGPAGIVDVPSKGTDGSFSTIVGGAERSTARILADGYIPQPLLAASVPADKEELEVTVRLTRVPKRVRGVVLDHAGKPLKDAAVFAVGPQTGLNLVGGEARPLSLSSSRLEHAPPHVRTDAEGRFELATEGAPSVAVSHVRFDRWHAVIPKRGDMTIRLPEPARLEIKLDIEGAEKESVVMYQFLSQQDFANGIVISTRSASIANPGKLTLAAMSPGKYQYWRGSGRMQDREFFELTPGQVKKIDHVRAAGARVRGKVTWSADAKLSGIHLVITSNDEAATVYAAVQVSEDGTFLTERVPPGSLHLAAYAYKVESLKEMSMSGLRVPSYWAQVSIEVPMDGEVKIPDVVLKGPAK